ncbi:MAG: hypothetical protein IJK52_06345 [Oscillospiraceae bacterium]|nr:hypothetical protein [Oscillospiraceae bacterium]
MFQIACLILTCICVLSLVAILTRNFLTLSKSKRSGKISMDFKLLKVFEFHMEHEAKQ